MNEQLAGFSIGCLFVVLGLILFIFACTKLRKQAEEVSLFIKRF
jgi:Sec-independent protein translocase protein TatA